MLSRRPYRTNNAVVLGLALSFGLAVAGTAFGQGHTPDPYNIVGEYNRQYEPYMYATYPNSDAAVPNQDRLEGRSGVRSANQFSDYVNSLDGAEDDGSRFAVPSSRLAGIGTPYYRAYRRYDQEFHREYRPNQDADSGYYSSQKKRDDKYFEALRAKDPKRRAQLLREFNAETSRAARLLSTARGKPLNNSGRDRLTPGDSALDPEGDPESDADRSPAPPPPSSRVRPSPSTFTPSPSPSRNRYDLALPPVGTLAPSRNRSGAINGMGSPLGTTPGLDLSPTPRTGLTPSEILENSRRMGRGLEKPATRTTAPAPAAARRRVLPDTDEDKP